MASKADARSRAEERFERAQKTSEEAKSAIDRELDATRKKTEKLRELRLAKEAADVTAGGKMLAGKRTKAKRIIRD